MLLITDVRDNSLKLVDFKTGNLIDILRHSKLSSPGCLYVTKKEEIFVYDVSNSKILIFEFKKFFLNFLREFKVLNVSFISDMKVNQDKNNYSLLYISSVMKNRISIWDTENGNYMKSFKVDHPSYMEFSDEKLFVVSYTICDETIDDNKLVRITDGSNCIFVFDKSTYELINKIDLNNWLKPTGLYLDSFSNIVTTAFEIDNDGFISKNRFVYTIDQNGELLHKVETYGILRSYYIQFIDKKIVASYDQSLKFIEYDWFSSFYCYVYFK